MKPLIALLIALTLGPGCVTLVHRGAPDAVSCDHQVFESVRLDGFEIPFQELHVSSTTGFVGWFGSTGVATGSYTSVTSSIEDKSTTALKDVAARYLEDIGLVGRSNVDSKGPANLVLEGRLTISGSWANAWSAPFNCVTALTLVLPITWATEVTGSLRVYGRNGEFLKEYTSDVESVRSWYHWLDGVRVRAGNERRTEGGFLAMRSLLDAFARDALAGEFEEALDEDLPAEPIDDAHAPQRLVPVATRGEDPLIRAALGRP